MRKYLLTTVAAAALFTGSANANVICDFSTPDVTTFGSGFLRLELTSAGSSFNLFGGPSGGAIPPGTPYSGDVDRFVSFTVGGLDVMTPTFRVGSIALALTFNNGGNVTSSSLNFLGQLYDVSLMGSSGPNATGTYNVDFSNCLPQGCALSGRWQEVLVTVLRPVPEPMSLALFGVGLAGLAAVRRRAA